MIRYKNRLNVLRFFFGGSGGGEEGADVEFIGPTGGMVLGGAEDAIGVEIGVLGGNEWTSSGVGGVLGILSIEMTPEVGLEGTTGIIGEVRTGGRGMSLGALVLSDPGSTAWSAVFLIANPLRSEAVRGRSCHCEDAAKPGAPRLTSRLAGSATRNIATGYLRFRTLGGNEWSPIELLESMGWPTKHRSGSP